MNVESYDFASIIEDRDKRLVLIIYDIVNNKTRSKMVKLLESYGRRVQKSAFEVLIASRQYNVLIDKIGKVMDQEDNVRIYRLNSSNEVLLLGTSMTIYEDEVIIV